MTTFAAPTAPISSPTVLASSLAPRTENKNIFIPVYIHVGVYTTCVRNRFAAASAWSSFRRRWRLLPLLLRAPRKINNSFRYIYTYMLVYKFRPYVTALQPLPPRLCFVADDSCFLSSPRTETIIYIHVDVYLGYMTHVRAQFAAATASTSFFVNDGACFLPCLVQSIRRSFLGIQIIVGRDANRSQPRPPRCCEAVPCSLSCSTHVYGTADVRSLIYFFSLSGLRPRSFFRGIVLKCMSVYIGDISMSPHIYRQKYNFNTI